MEIAAYILVGLATLAALYIAKSLIVDVAWRDHRVRPTSSTAKTLAVCVVIGLALVALPGALGVALITWAHPIWAMVVAAASLALSGFGFVAVANGGR